MSPNVISAVHRLFLEYLSILARCCFWCYQHLRGNQTWLCGWESIA